MISISKVAENNRLINQQQTADSMTAMGPILPHYKSEESSLTLEYVNGPLIDVKEEKTDNPVLRRVLADLRLTQEEFGRSHAKVAEAWSALGLVRVHMQHDAEQALICHEHALRIYRDNNQTTEYAITMNDVAHCYEQLQHQDRAYETYREALGLMKQEGLSEYHPMRISTSRALSRLRRG